MSPRVGLQERGHMEFNSLSHPHRIGDVNEQMVATYLVAAGFDVYLPINRSPRADLVYLNDGRACRVQVKTGTVVQVGRNSYEQCRLGCQKASTRKEKGPYRAGEVDELWVVGTHLWKFPASVFVDRPSLMLTKESTSPRPWRMQYDPDDYIVVRCSREAPYRDRLK